MGILNQKNWWPTLIYQFEHSGTHYYIAMALAKWNSIKLQLFLLLKLQLFIVSILPTYSYFVQYYSCQQQFSVFSINSNSINHKEIWCKITHSVLAGIYSVGNRPAVGFWWILTAALCTWVSVPIAGTSSLGCHVVFLSFIFFFFTPFHNYG